MRIRSDSWTEEHDLVLAETVLRHVREGSTQLKAFEEVGDRLDKTSAACGFRWNSVVRKRFEKALQLAKKHRKEKIRASEKQETAIVESSNSTIKKAQQELTVREDMPLNERNHYYHEQSNPHLDELDLDRLIQSLIALRNDNRTSVRLQEENDRLKSEVRLLREENQKLEREIKRIEQSTATIQEDYETLMNIMNRARRLAILEDTDRPSSKFKMDVNGNIEQIAE